MSTIVHFDVPVEDVERAKNFYSNLFGWKIERVPGPMEYYNIETTDDKGEPSIGGGMGKSMMPNPVITNYIGVQSVDEYIKKVIQLGGKIIMPKTIITGFGYLAVCLDTEGNRFGLWETDENAKM
jgi:predicted enzyme related to lactoylglutathione lyase